MPKVLVKKRQPKEVDLKEVRPTKVEFKHHDYTGELEKIRFHAQFVYEEEDNDLTYAAYTYISDEKRVEELSKLDYDALLMQLKAHLIEEKSVT